jgi:hypothetical protein
MGLNNIALGLLLGLTLAWCLHAGSIRLEEPVKQNEPAAAVKSNENPMS